MKHYIFMISTGTTRTQPEGVCCFSPCLAPTLTVLASEPFGDVQTFCPPFLDPWEGMDDDMNPLEFLISLPSFEDLDRVDGS
jgi:hypothetical protein